jgi:hypothetical protein
VRPRRASGALITKRTNRQSDSRTSRRIVRVIRVTSEARIIDLSRADGELIERFIGALATGSSDAGWLHDVGAVIGAAIGGATFWDDKQPHPVDLIKRRHDLETIVDGEIDEETLVCALRDEVTGHFTVLSDTDGTKRGPCEVPCGAAHCD